MREDWFAGATTDSDTASLDETKNLLRELKTLMDARNVQGYLRLLRQFETQGKLYALRELHFVAGMRLNRPKLLIQGSKAWHEDEFKENFEGAEKLLKTTNMAAYVSRQRFILRLMRTANISWSRESYFLVLEHARFLKDRNLATQTWDAMSTAGIVPDSSCYNSYIATIAVPRRIFDKFRLKKRNDNTARVEAYKAYQASADDASRKAVILYQEMVKRGVQPNAHTIELLILALGRAGNLNALRSIIKQTWGLYVSDDARNWQMAEIEGVADEHDEEGLDDYNRTDTSLPEPKYDANSSLFPSHKTLLAVVSALGIHHQTGLALEYIAQFRKVYDTQVTTRVTANLMQLALADSTITGGFTDRQQVRRIFDVARSAFGVQPDQSIYSVLINSELQQENTNKALDVLEEMLATIEAGHLPPYKSKTAQTRHIIRSVLSKTRRLLSATHNQITRRLAQDVKEGGDDAIRLRRGISESRAESSEKLLEHWRKRIALHLVRMQSYKTRRKAVMTALYEPDSP
ncbi:hypothetical protein BCR37DRAFT_395390 [Protomyces lactucae-debilis]|uniref:Pentatricopeptide repeat protein n=1 Tax=Protomyces lactucae-debilis TaxID=2754530 RepID=A0A1Y2EWZ0_PROLT|nr:uncharacterized protein BCR37DRAFT_395390 [Protomyces lactucae-debilis]ORY76093.1 hypothetical protein BCR37DRAFT_395390 [Protomyces lactucae-debilis]